MSSPAGSYTISARRRREPEYRSSSPDGLIGREGGLGRLTDTCPVNLIDIGIVVLLAFGLIAGWRSGFFPQLLGLAGAAAGASSGRRSPCRTPTIYLEGVDPTLRAIGGAGRPAGAIGVGEAIGSNLGAAIGRRLGEGVLSDLDRMAGALAGLAQGLSSSGSSAGCSRRDRSPRWPPRPNARGSSARSRTGCHPRRRTSMSWQGGWTRRACPRSSSGSSHSPPRRSKSRPTSRPSGSPEVAADSTLVVRATACGRVSTGTGFVVGQGWLPDHQRPRRGRSQGRRRRVRRQRPERCGGRAVRPQARCRRGPARSAVKAAPLAFATSDPPAGNPRGGARPSRWRTAPGDPGGGLRQLLGRGPGPVRHGPGDPPDRRAAGRHRAWRQRRPADPARRDGRRRGLRRGPERPDRSGMPSRRSPSQARIRPAVGSTGTVPTGACTR